jgi:hypothetical protein
MRQIVDQHPIDKTKAAAQRTAAQEPYGSKSLDDVDFGREIAGHFKTNFLLANGRLCPDFHDVSSSDFIDRHFLLNGDVVCPVAKDQSHFANACQTFRDHGNVSCYIISYIMRRLAPWRTRHSEPTLFG